MSENAATRPRHAAFLDRDGVINVDHGYVHRPERLELTPTAAEGLRLLNEAGRLVVVVTNQSGVARGLFGCAEVEAFHDNMRRILAAQGARIDAFYYCPYHPDGSVEAFRREHPDRKPGPGMLLRAIDDWDIDPASSFLIGDQPRDLAAARAAGVAGYPIARDSGDLAQVVRGSDVPIACHDRRDKPLKRYTDWMAATALPLWADAGYDAVRGRFHERLDADGRPRDVPHRVMVQARQIYVFAHATQLGWFDGGTLAERGFASLMRDYAVDAGDRLSFRFSSDGRGGGSDVRDAYAHAFVLFAIARLHRLTGDPALLDLADRTIGFIEGEMTDDRNGGLHDALPLPDQPAKRQNPQMHLLESYLALEATAPGRDYIGRARPLLALLHGRMLHPDTGMLVEHFGPGWEPHPDPARRHCVEPGHHFEWSWLLAEHQRLSGENSGTTQAALYRSALAHGVTRDDRIVDEIDANGRVVKRSTRLWPYTEAIKAATARHAAGDPDAAGFAHRMADTLFDRFLDRPFAGGWTDHFAEDGTALIGDVPASSLYHLMLGAAESCKLPMPGSG